MRLEITGCSDAMLWYAKLVGETVPLLREHADCYISRQPSGLTNMVLKKDARVIPD